MKYNIFTIVTFLVRISLGQSNTTSVRSLIPFRHDSFPLGSIKATSWLQDQLQLEADGLAGHLFDFYRYVHESTWVGGTYEYSQLHESAPYWFNFIVPLAFTLDDPRIKAQAAEFLQYTLDHQAEDGWLGPETTPETRGIWARCLLLFGLTQYAEADPAQTEAIVDAMQKFTTLVHTMLMNNFTGLIEHGNDDFDPYGFGLARTQELPLSLQWLYQNHPQNNSNTIWETMELMFEGGRIEGYDWTTFFVEGVFPTEGTPNVEGNWAFFHGVNLAEGLRYPSILYRMTHNETLPIQTLNGVNWTATYQLTRAGTITADEHVGGLSPQRGSETCISVEMMFSMAYLYRLYGTNMYADMAERVAFNALPAALSPDWWSHQYVQQTNQPWSRNLTGEPYQNVVPYGNTFGLEPNFPCCTVNHGQGYPKYVASSYIKDGNSGIVHALLGPTSLVTKLNGSDVSISCKTNYPFSEILTYTIESSTSFTFSIRIPDWSVPDHSFVQVNNDKQLPLSPNPESLQEFNIHPGRTTIELTLGMAIVIGEPRNGAVAVYYGPLLYALDVEYADPKYHIPLNWTNEMPLPLEQITNQTRDWVLNATSKWQYAIDPDSIVVEQVYSTEGTINSPVWQRGGAPTILWANAWQITWNETLGTAALPPVNPVVSGDPTKVKLIPYGAAKLRIAEFPVAIVQQS